MAAAIALQISTAKPRQAPLAPCREKPGTFAPTPQVRTPFCLMASSRSPALPGPAARRNREAPSAAARALVNARFLGKLRALPKPEPRARWRANHPDDKE